MMFALSKIVRKIIPGVSWQNPFVNFGLHTLDPLDRMVRWFRGLDHLPPYSIRVRSNGIRAQFGGKRFAFYGELISQILQRHAQLHPEICVLEIGCGCGRAALALAKILNDGKFTGMDIEKVSLESCRNNHLLKKKRFKFDLMDIYNREYNPSGSCSAKSYKFPYEDGSFDVIFLISVFTHMLPEDVSCYIKEISRMLKPGGGCLISTFLMDYGKAGKDLSFLFNHGCYCVYREQFPEIAVGYYQSFFEKEFSSCKMFLAEAPLFGTWRDNPDSKSLTQFPQDILVFAKQKFSKHHRS